MNLLLIFMPSGSEWIYILLIVLLVFGGKKIPELAKGLGKGVKNFKDGINEAKEEINKAKDDIDKTDAEEPKKEEKADK
jgi:sec-independent protein translocase protein TatA